jgi:hypothetical protein
MTKAAALKKQAEQVALRAGVAHAGRAFKVIEFMTESHPAMPRRFPHG